MLRAVLTFAMASWLAGTSPQPPVGTGSVAGRVFDAATGQPIAGATVRLSQTRGGYRSEAYGTDVDGRFSFTGLGAGRFKITASADTYLGGAVGKRRPLGEEVWITLSIGEHRGDLTIPMFKGGMLSGRVVDEHDKPVVGFWVEAWPRAPRPILFNDTPRHASARTDSNGNYRITNVIPGDYVVVARVYRDTLRQSIPGPSPCDPPMLPPRPGMPSLPVPVPAPPERPVGTLYSSLANGLRQPRPRADGTPMTYRTTFIPGVFGMAEASTVSVASGESTAGLDFQLRPVVATKVSGELTSPRGFSSGGEVRLRLAGDLHWDTSEARTWLAAGSGAFTLLDVPVGSYYLEPTRYAAAPSCDTKAVDSSSSLTRVKLDVPVNGVDGVVVPLVAGTTVTGSLVHKGEKRLPVDLSLSLSATDPTPAAFGPIGEIANNRFTIDGVLPGSYELYVADHATTTTWWLQSVTVGGRDATGLPFVVGPEGLDNVTVVMTDRPTSIRGTVNTNMNKPSDDATVVLFPVDRMTWPNARIRSLRFQTSRALRGVYDFDNVPAGEYFIAAFDETMLDPWPSLTFLQRAAASATRVSVKSGLAQVVALTVTR